MKRLSLFALLLLLLLPAGAARADAVLSAFCQVKFAQLKSLVKIGRAVDWQRVTSLTEKGVPRLTAFRLVRDYPALAQRLLDAPEIHWVTMYRGIKRPLSRFRPGYFRALRGSNELGSRNGMWVSSNFVTGLMYSRHGEPTGTIFEYRMPDIFLPAGMSEDKQVDRQFFPEQDLFVVRYIGDANKQGRFETRNWSSYEDFYLAQKTGAQNLRPAANKSILYETLFPRNHP